MLNNDAALAARPFDIELGIILFTDFALRVQNPSSDTASTRVQQFLRPSHFGFGDTLPAHVIGMGVQPDVE